jgi:cathepsin D
MVLGRWLGQSQPKRYQWPVLQCRTKYSVSTTEFFSIVYLLNGTIQVQVDQVSKGLVDNTLSGIMGLAFSTIASTHSTPFWEALSNNGLLQAQEMSFWLNRLRDVPNAPPVAFGGEFTLGGTNTSLFSGDIEFINVPPNQETFWLLSVSGELIRRSFSVLGS